MGLLDKANKELHTKSLRAKSEECLTGGGLLQRALHSKEQPPAGPELAAGPEGFAPMEPSEEEPRQASDEEESLADIMGEDFAVSLPEAKDLLLQWEPLPRDIQRPSAILEILHTELPTEKSALLLRNFEKEEFQLWASRGFDETTKHRLRLPTDLCEGFFPENQSTMLSLSKEEAQPLKPFFSYRENLGREVLLLMPLYQESVLTGLFLSSPEAGLFPETLQKWESLWDALAFPLGEAMMDYHTITEGQDAILEVNVQDPQALMDSLSLFLGQSRQKHQPVTVLSVSFRELMENQSQEFPTLDPYRFREILLATAASLFGSNSEAIPYSAYRVIFLLSGKGVQDPQLVLYQIRQQVKEQIPLPPGEDELFRYTFFSSPGADDDPEDIIQTILPE